MKIIKNVDEYNEMVNSIKFPNNIHFDVIKLRKELIKKWENNPEMVTLKSNKIYYIKYMTFHREEFYIDTSIGRLNVSSPIKNVIVSNLFNVVEYEVEFPLYDPDIPKYTLIVYGTDEMITLAADSIIDAIEVSIVK